MPDKTLCQVVFLKNQAINPTSSYHTSRKLLLKFAPVSHEVWASKALYIPQNNPHEDGESKATALAAIRAIFDAGLDGE